MTPFSQILEGLIPEILLYFLVSFPASNPWGPEDYLKERLQETTPQLQRAADEANHRYVAFANEVRNLFFIAIRPIRSEPISNSHDLW